MRLLTAYRWALWLDPDALDLGGDRARRWSRPAGCSLVAALSRDRALGLAAVLVLAALLSARSVVADPFGAVLGYAGVAFVLFGVVVGLPDRVRLGQRRRSADPASGPGAAGGRLPVAHGDDAWPPTP